MEKVSVLGSINPGIPDVKVIPCFPLTYEDQLALNIWLPQEAHKGGLSICLKNDMDQVCDLLPYFD
jgi:hypothetical protein